MIQVKLFTTGHGISLEEQINEFCKDKNDYTEVEIMHSGGAVFVGMVKYEVEQGPSPIEQEVTELRRRISDYRNADKEQLEFKNKCKELEKEIETLKEGNNK